MGLEKHKVIIWGLKDSRPMDEWCASHCIHGWVRYLAGLSPRRYVYEFISTRDALMFKLKWYS